MTPSPWTTTPPCLAGGVPLPPGEHGVYLRRVLQLCPEVRPVLLPQPVPHRRAGAGQDLPLGLHRPHRVGERLLRGVRHGGKHLHPLRGAEVRPGPAGAGEAKDETRRYLGCDLLILDDLGSELSTPFVQSALYTLINTRLTADKRTVISSNLTMDQVRARYTPQIASRLEGEYRVLPFYGEDIRLLRKQTL